MAYDFPASPSVGTLFAPAGGPTWQWNGSAWLAASPAGLVQEAPADGQNYVRRNGVWVLAPGTAEARNRIVNGSVTISQELSETGSSVNGAVIADQWYFFVAGITADGRKATAGDNLPQIYANVTVAKGSLAAGDNLALSQRVEGVAIRDFRWGSVDAKPAVLRFELYCTNPGTYTASIRNAAGNRSFLAPAVVTVPSTWTIITIPIPADTTGVWPTDNTHGMSVTVTFAAGTTLQGVPGWQAGGLTTLSTATNGAALTGAHRMRNVGLYLDPQNTGIAPPWQMPDEAQELIACQRYFEVAPSVVNTSVTYLQMGWKVRKRVQPAVSTQLQPGGSGGAFVSYNFGNVADGFYQNAANSQVAQAQVTGNARM